MSVRSRSAPFACRSHAVEPKSCIVEPGTAHSPSSCSLACTTTLLSPSRGLRFLRQLSVAAASFLSARSSSIPGRNDFIVIMLDTDEGEVFDVIGRMPQSFCKVSVASCCWPACMQHTCRLLSDAGVLLRVIGVLLRDNGSR